MDTRPNLGARLFSTSVIVLGVVVLAAALVTWEVVFSVRYLMYFALALMAAGLKTGKPAFPGTLSIGYVFLLLGIIEFSLAETLLIGCATVTVQEFVERRRGQTLRSTLFQLGNVCIAVTAADLVFHYSWTPTSGSSPMIPLAASALVLFGMNTFPAAAYSALTQRSRIMAVWHECSFWTLPFYLSGAVVALMVSGINRTLGWDYGTASLPIVLFVCRVVRRYLDEVRHRDVYLDDLETRHYRVVEALGIAVEARKHSTYLQLKRTETYALGIAEELDLTGEELRSLRVSALVRDIGMLSVPEQITSKPGRLTAEEYEKMKSHAEIGADMLEQLQFAPSVVTAVRHHHERWDGEGYPDRVKESMIPIGARILAVADCFSSLLVSRPYRKAYSREDALSFIISQAGVAFDPGVAGVLAANHEEFEKRVHAKMKQGRDFAGSIVDARFEAQCLFDLSQDLGRSLCLNETLFTFVQRVRPLVPYDCLAIYLLKGSRLVPEHVDGAECSVYYGLEIPLGEGISGTVASTSKAVLNEDPRVEVLHTTEEHRGTDMRSAVVVPVEGTERTIGAVALYRREENAFDKDDLRVLLDAARKLSPSVQNALQYQDVADSATTDSLTGLANARSLFLHLDGELARCQRTEAPLSILVCDLDGFKHVNDRHGHLMGNNVLKAAAQVLEVNCREYDFVARMGGDEFVMVLPGAPSEAITEKTRKLIGEVARCADEVCPGCGVSMSVGVAHYPEDGRDAETLLAHGDKEMYYFKENHKISNRARGYAFDWANAAAAR